VGFPHSDIRGSSGARPSPQLNAACHVLHRLCMPRHPPNALICRLIAFSETRSQTSVSKRPDKSPNICSQQPVSWCQFPCQNAFHPHHKSGRAIDGKIRKTSVRRSLTRASTCKPPQAAGSLQLLKTLPAKSCEQPSFTMSIILHLRSRSKANGRTCSRFWRLSSDPARPRSFRASARQPSSASLCQGRSGLAEP
jgi:hypothetical protein